MIKKDIVLIECPRDAMQGWSEFIPTEQKINYLNALLKVGFDTLDFGSFVSSKAIPQMRDTKDVIPHLDLSNTRTKLLAIIANVRGAQEASDFDEINYLGFPLSVSEEFQRRNTNSTIEESISRIDEIQSICVNKNKQLVVYISMGFGNPYGEPWNAEVVIDYVGKLVYRGIKTIALADTIGVSTPENISSLFSNILPEFPGINIGAHLHSTPDKWKEKIDAAAGSGCKRFDSALKGIGGCPMADDHLTGNLATENLIDYFGGEEMLSLNRQALSVSMKMANHIFS